MKLWKKSLMARLVGYFMLLSLINVGLVGYLAYIQARAALKGSIFEKLEAAATLKENELNNWVADQRREVLFISSLWEVRSRARDLLTQDPSNRKFQTAYNELRQYLTSLIAFKPALQDIFILSGTGGRILLSTNRAFEGEYRVNDNFFVYGRLGTYVQNVYPWPVTLKPTMTIATPLLDETWDQRLGVLAVHLNLERMDRIILERASLGASGETYLVDQYNTFVSAARFGRGDYPRGVHTEGIDTALQKISGSGNYTNYAGEPVIGVYRWLEARDLALLAEINQHEAFAPARRLAWTIILVGLLSAGLLAVGVYLLARQIAGPILAITDTAVRVTGGNLNQTAPVQTEDEIGVLARAFNRMTAELRELYEALQRSEQHFRSLIENASDIIMVLDVNATMRYISPSAKRVLGYEPEELREKSTFDFIHPDDALKIKKIFRHPSKFPGVSPSLELRVRHKDGSWRILEVMINNLLADKVVAGVVVNSRDITQRKEAVEALRQAHDQLEAKVVERTAELSVAKEEAEAAARVKRIFWLK